MFAEKLNFLMDITKSRNSVLANAVSLDASHVSRLRRGGRKLPKKQEFLRPMSEFFARGIKADYQKKILREALGLSGGWPQDEKAAAQVIYHWLSEPENANEASVERILTSFASPPRSAPPPVSTETVPASGEGSAFYYGIPGKREAVIRFLTAVCGAEKPCTLLLFSDEEMSWLYEDPGFAKQWAVLLIEALRRGNRVRIVHTVSRGMNEMLEAVAKWVPVYMTGAIEPYYYPKLRDGVFQRTLFIAPGTAAVVSTSVRMRTQDMLNIYIDNSAAVGALALEYDNYFALCRPLMRIFNMTASEKFWELFAEFEAGKTESIMLRSGPPLFSMPRSVAKALVKRSGSPYLLPIYEKSARNFEKHIDEHKVTVVMMLPTDEEIFESRFPIALSDMLLSPGLSYTREEYRLIIENMIGILKTHRNFSVALQGGRAKNVMLYGKEDVGILMSKPDIPGVVFAFSEPNMTAAFLDHLHLQLTRAEIREKEAVISELQKLINKLA